VQGLQPGEAHVDDAGYRAVFLMLSCSWDASLAFLDLPELCTCGYPSLFPTNIPLP
jgi:hypothetical protein